MGITDNPNDFYGTKVKGINIPVNIYYLNNDLINDPANPNCLAPINQSGQVLSMIYTPFLEESDLTIWRIPYDYVYFGEPGGQHPYVFKVLDMVTQGPLIKEIGHFSLFEPRVKVKTKSPTNESKLYQYPYSYIDVTDYINPPLTIKSTYLKSDTGTVSVRVRQTLSLQGGYTIFCQSMYNSIPIGYKGDKNGTLEGIMSQGSLELPTSSNQYSTWLANNKSQFMTANQIANRNYQFSNYRNKVNATTGLVGGALTQLGGLNILGALGTGIDVGVNYDTTQKQNRLDRQNFIDNQLAMISDKKNAPRNVNLCGGDILNTLDISQKKVDAIRYRITEHYRQKICDYFTLYGYKQNKLMYKTDNGLYKSRKYFNYIKTMECNIRTHADMDKEELEELKDIFNNGITFWHYFRCKQDNILMHDVDDDNEEVYN